MGGARERKEARVPRVHRDRLGGDGMVVRIATGRMTVAPPPAMFCNGANEAHCPQSWAGAP
jgi:hypothetical protein